MYATGCLVLDFVATWQQLFLASNQSPKFFSLLEFVLCNTLTGMTLLVDLTTYICTCICW